MLTTASAVVAPGKVGRFATNKHPIQSFLLGDYRAKPETAYECEAVALVGPIDKKKQFRKFCVSCGGTGLTKEHIWANCDPADADDNRSGLSGVHRRLRDIVKVMHCWVISIQCLNPGMLVPESLIMLVTDVSQR
ncbi:MAG: hypothetical protein K0M60_03775 [Hydrogenophaga sp.]|nr:hypothetical protein [Hydrogenophaga sp.]